MYLNTWVAMLWNDCILLLPQEGYIFLELSFKKRTNLN